MRSYPDDGYGPAIERNLLADNPRIATQVLHPVGIAENYDRIGTRRLSLGRQDEPPQHRLEPEYGKVIAGNVVCDKAVRLLPINAESIQAQCIAAQAIENRGGLAGNIAVIGDGKCFQENIQILLQAQHGNPPGVLDRQWT
ncbi:MAG TPA: hypothetical protein VJN48_09025 [Terriglobales bacterium]|nr:hypothetical protein [Terriglobales bacterium]